MSSPQYMAQDPRTLLYYRFNADASDVIADVPEDKFREKGYLFHLDHLTHLPPDVILTESNPELGKYIGRRKAQRMSVTPGRTKKQIAAQKKTWAKKNAQKKKAL